MPASMSATRQAGQLPAFTSKIVTLPSLEVLHTWWPSLAIAMELTRPSCTCQVRMQVPVSTSFIATMPSLLPQEHLYIHMYRKPDRVTSLHRQQEKIELVWPPKGHSRCSEFRSSKGADGRVFRQAPQHQVLRLPAISQQRSGTTCMCIHAVHLRPHMICSDSLLPSHAGAHVTPQRPLQTGEDLGGRTP